MYPQNDSARAQLQLLDTTAWQRLETRSVIRCRLNCAVWAVNCRCIWVFPYVGLGEVLKELLRISYRAMKTNQLARFGAFAFDLRQSVLSRDGVVIPLAPKDTELLLLLVKNSGQIVEKKAIFDQIWPQTFVEEGNLSRHIFSLRQVLAELGRPIETVPKRGYRFVTPVRFENGLIEQNLDPATPVDGKRQESPHLLRLTQAIGSTLGNQSIFGHYRSSLALPITLLLLAATAIGFVRARVPQRISVAVLPVENLTGDPAKEYICDGLTEELIAQLGALDDRGFGVVTRTSSMAYKSSAKTARQIAQELQVNYLLEGSLRGSAERFRITEQLIRFPGEQHVWTHEFDGTTSDLIGMEDEIGQAITKSVAALHSAAVATTSTTRLH
jgi:TolB-like protein/DNA-binding winged helix-turn-helix (wHTH) protein